MTSAILRNGFVATWLAASTVVASAQDSSRHIYVAPGQQSGGAPGKTQVYEAGAGFERLLDGGLGVQVEGAALTYFNAGGSRTVGGIASVGGVFHFAHFASWGQTIDPVILAEYSLQFRDYTTNMVSFGAGLRYWFQDDRALVIEWRHHNANHHSPIARYWVIEIGLAFR